MLVLGVAKIPGRCGVNSFKGIGIPGPKPVIFLFAGDIEFQPLHFVHELGHYAGMVGHDPSNIAIMGVGRNPTTQEREPWWRVTLTENQCEYFEATLEGFDELTRDFPAPPVIDPPHLYSTGGCDSGGSQEVDEVHVYERWEEWEVALATPCN